MSIPPQSPVCYRMEKGEIDPGAATKNVHHADGESQTPKRALRMRPKFCSVPAENSQGLSSQPRFLGIVYPTELGYNTRERGTASNY